MKKNIAFFIFVVAMSILSVYADSWDDFANVDRMWDGQKSITNQEFENVMEKLEEKNKQKEEKVKQKKIKKMFGNGTVLHSENTPNNRVLEMQSPDSRDDGILINIPVNLIVDNQIVEKGYYKILSECNKKENKFYIQLYQSQFLKATIEMTPTEDDYGESEINFAKVIPVNETCVKIIYGSLDFNAYTYVHFTD